MTRTDFLRTMPSIGPYEATAAFCAGCFAPRPGVLVNSQFCLTCKPCAPTPGPLFTAPPPAVRDLIVANAHKSDTLHDAAVLLARGSWWEEHQTIIDTAVAAVALIPTSGRWVGSVGMRLDLALHCTSVTPNGFGDYGEKFIAKFTDADGNLFTWFTGEKCWAAPGEDFTCRGTIRDHTEFRGVKENIVTNMRLPKEKE